MELSFTVTVIFDPLFCTRTPLVATEELLAKEGLSLKDVFKVTSWLVNKQDFAGYNAVYATRLSDPYPARTTVISDLAMPSALIEVEFMASRPD